MRLAGDRCSCLEAHGTCLSIGIEKGRGMDSGIQDRQQLLSLRGNHHPGNEGEKSYANCGEEAGQEGYGTCVSAGIGGKDEAPNQDDDGAENAEDLNGLSQSNNGSCYPVSIQITVRGALLRS